MPTTDLQTTVSETIGTVYSNDLYRAAEVLTIILGSIMVLENSVLLAVIVRLIVKLRLKKENNDVLHHMLFVITNDTISAFVIMILGLIRVTGDVSAFFCAYTLLLSMSLQIMTQGNVTCICVQRYIGARNIRKLSTGKQMFRNLTLAGVDIMIGGISLTASFVRSTVSSDRVVSEFCSFQSVLGYESQAIGSIFYVIGVMFLVSADVFCISTIRKLKTEINAVVPSETVSTATSSTSSSAQTSVKLRQQKAVITMFLILAIANVSVIPTVVVYSLVFTGFRINSLNARILYLSLFLNALLNPIIIGTRVNDIRKQFKDCYGIVRKCFRN